MLFRNIITAVGIEIRRVERRFARATALLEQAQHGPPYRRRLRDLGLEVLRLIDVLRRTHEFLV